MECHTFKLVGDFVDALEKREIHGSRFLSTSTMKQLRKLHNSEENVQTTAKKTFSISLRSFDIGRIAEECCEKN